MAKKKTAPKPKAEIKPAPVAEQIDQTTQITPVQTLTDEQVEHTPIQPATVLVDPSVKTDPIIEEPVVNKDKPDTDPLNADILDKNVEPVNEKHQKEKVGEVKEPTRYGNGKEVSAEHIEDSGISRHFPPPIHGDVTGGKNEWPR